MKTPSENKPTDTQTFPAERITTQLEWSDLVLEDRVMAQVQEVANRITHSDALDKGCDLAGKTKTGYRAIFSGPSGTGKTLTATLLGKATGREVYRVGRSKIVSKYIGETEKNLARVFDAAGRKNWILFFDEADALFGKRSEVTDAHDRFANLEVSYLLQRIEEFPGLVILSTNNKDKLDEVFLRRFQTTIDFSNPCSTRDSND